MQARLVAKGMLNIVLVIFLKFGKICLYIHSILNKTTQFFDLVLSPIS
jgi:hypothetical protein